MTCAYCHRETPCDWRIVHGDTGKRCLMWGCLDCAKKREREYRERVSREREASRQVQP